MKLATWNIDSLTVRLPQVLDWLSTNPVDISPRVRLDAMDASLFKREENWSAEIEQPLIRKESLADGVDPLMDTASQCPRRDRPRSSQTPQGIRHES